MRPGYKRSLSLLLLLSWALAIPAAGQTGALDPPLILTVDGNFPGLGGTSVFTITGPPGATYRLDAADIPEERSSSLWGTHFLQLDNDFVVQLGTLSAFGEATVVVTHTSDSALDGHLRYFQARGLLGTARGLSNSAAVRFSSPPSGPRHPQALAVTPDGAIAFVAHEVDGTVTMVDAVNDQVVMDIPVAVVDSSLSLPIELAIDPEGRHAFVINPRLRRIPILDTFSGSISGELVVPPGCRGMAFAFSPTRRLIYVTNERDRVVLTFAEPVPGTFSLIRTTPLQGSGPGPIAVLLDGTLLVGHRESLELEIVKPGAAQPTLARIPLGSPPLDIVVSRATALVPTFTPTEVGGDGRNEVLEINLRTRQVVGAHLVDLGTDYFNAARTAFHLAVVGSGSGTLAIADATTFAAIETIDLAPGDPLAVPQEVAAVTHPVTGLPSKLYVLNRFRETIRPVDLAGGPPFALLPEIALAHSGQPRVPLVDLDDVENGEWLFDSVQFFNGSAANPNPVTCATCHTYGLSFSVTQANRQAQPLFDMVGTEPFGQAGNVATIPDFTVKAFNKHGVVGGTLDPQVQALTDLYQQVGIPVPSSPHRAEDGSLPVEAQAGKIVFEGAANCSACHTAPLFIPVDPSPKTITAGVGTGLAPANVPTLRGLWATAPYLHDGAAQTIMDALLLNVSDQHGTTSTLTQQELDDLVAYLLCL